MAGGGTSTRRGQDRLERARRALREAGLDALLLFSGANLTYLAGSSVTEITAGRTWYLVVPARGQPVLIVQAWRELQARRETWIDDVRSYQILSELPLAELDRVWRQSDLEGARVGLELAGEMRLGITESQFAELREHYASTAFEDASPLLWGLRTIKDEGEIDCLRRAGAITAEAYRRTFSALRPGLPRSAVPARMKAAMLELGGSAPWVLASIGRGGYDYGTEAVGDEPLEPGDMAWMDAGCAVGGYWSDYSRAAVIGPASAEQRELHEAVHRITADAVAMIGPGRPVAEIAAACNRALNALTGPGLIPLSTLAGRIGHGLGLDVTELPHVAEYDRTLLEPGMVITAEPGIATAAGTFHVEENVLVTGDGCEVLSTAPWRLTEVS
jgi:Xaa-Pro dipeptidase